MSNKPKHFKSHPNNVISNIEKLYNYFIKRAVKYANLYGFSKHVGSKPVHKLKMMLNIK